MSRVLQRLRKLEAQTTDHSGLVPHTEDWFQYWLELAQNQLFRWQAEPAGNNTVSPSATLNLLFGTNGATPAETGLSINPNGTINFSSAQTFPGGGGGITGVTAGAGLSGGGNSGNVSYGCRS